MTSQLLDPPAPPTRRSATEIPLGLTGWGIRVSPDGGGMIVHRTRDPIQTLMIGITAAELETFAYHLYDAIGATR